MNKPIQKNPDDSRDREFTVVLEDIQSQFRVFGEGMQDMRLKLGQVDERLQRVEGKVDHLEVEVHSIKENLNFINKVLPTVATKDDLMRFEKRLTSLESSR